MPELTPLVPAYTYSLILTIRQGVKVKQPLKLKPDYPWH